MWGLVIPLKCSQSAFSTYLVIRMCKLTEMSDFGAGFVVNH